MKTKIKYGNPLLDKAYEKYFKQQKLTYEEYVLLLAVNDEVRFYHQDMEYQVLHEGKETTTMFVRKYEGKNKIFIKSEDFSSIIKMLEKFRISGKLIKDCWNEISFI